ncbi:MAG: glycosyltransferase [Pseudomonadota bacterium]
MKLEKIQTAASARRTAADSPGRWRGALDGTYMSTLYGWAVDTEQVNTRVVLEVCLNDEPIGSVTADVGRSDLTELFASLPQVPDDPCHGFVADLGSLLDSYSGSLTVRIANTDAVLDGVLFAEQEESAAPTAAISSVFSDGGLKLHGWARDAVDKKRALRVRAFLDSTQIAEVTANEEHPALRSHDVGRHGFTLDLPISLADGQCHSVRIIDDEGQPLNGSPVTVCCHAEGLAALLPGADALLTSVVDSYQRYVPRTLGMTHYRAWSARFDAAGPALSGAVGQRVGLIVCGDADEVALERTSASINSQGGATVNVYLPSAKRGKSAGFAAQLQRAFDDGCDAIGCVRAGDELAPHALAYALQGLGTQGAALVYTDSEQADLPWFKPAWNADYALGSDYPLELMLVTRTLVASLLQEENPPASQASFSWQALAALWSESASAIIHVPRVLYRFNSALSGEEKKARASAAAAALQMVEPDAALLPITAFQNAAEFLPRRTARGLSKRERAQSVSLIIPTRDHVELLERCITSLKKFTKWPGLEIIVVDNGSVLPKTKAYFKKLARAGVLILDAAGPFNFSKLNNVAVARASGDIVGLINNDIEALHEGWLDEMVGQLLRPGVGAVGAKLLWPNGMVQHGGVLLGVSNVAGHFGNRLATGDWGDHGRNQLVQQVSGVTAACLLVRKADYLAVGGMDEVKFPVAFNDVDLCLKLRSAGKTITWTPFAALLHAESASRGHEDTPQKRARAGREVDQLRQQWGPVLLRDPAYHPSLNLDAHSHAFGGLAMPPRDRQPRTASLARFEAAPVTTSVPPAPAARAKKTRKQ